MVNSDEGESDSSVRVRISVPTVSSSQHERLSLLLNVFGHRKALEPRSCWSEAHTAVSPQQVWCLQRRHRWPVAVLSPGTAGCDGAELSSASLSDVVAG